MTTKHFAILAEEKMDKDKSLIAATQKQAQKIRIDQLGYSVRELRSMYEDGDINVSPDFQRAFRWTKKQRSSLIESLLLSIPLPNIFISVDEEGKWDVIDGVQRLSTIFSFMGVKQQKQPTSNPRESSPWESFSLEKLELLKEAEEAEWNSLPIALKRKIENTRVDITLVDNLSTPEAKYNLFLRLNSGSVLTNQELRNCMLVMLNSQFFNQVKECSALNEFHRAVRLSKSREEGAFRDELVLRFFMQEEYTGNEKSLSEDFGDYLTKWTKNRAKESSDARSEAIDVKLFARVMQLLGEVGNGSALVRWDEKLGRRIGPTSNAAFEFVTSGLAKYIDFWEEHPEDLETKLLSMWETPSFIDHIGQGVNARDRFPKMVRNGRKYFSPLDRT